MKEIIGEDYKIVFLDSESKMEFEGGIRLRDTAAYKEISDLLTESYTSCSSDLFTLDLRRLDFLNSSGINTLSKFVLIARKSSGPKLKVVGNAEIFWQKKSIQNLQRLWSEVEISVD